MMIEQERQNLLARVVGDPEVQGGRPVIRGTRISVVRIVAALSAGASFEELQDDYGLAEEDVRAALAYAAKTVEDTEVHLLPAA